MPATLIIPQWDKGSTKQLQCYWHVLHPENQTMNVSIRLSVCVPGDFDNCYLRYVKLYEGIGVNNKPIRIPSDFKTTRFELVTNAVVIRYFGWAAKSPIPMKIDYRK
ncbi:unnamed protein product [Fasciola hepatica]|uniref:CUB domain-containing protein n=1 Tax=Fasciola hepatica TaxID=6192 RepID=A0ABC9HHC1_FASHE